MMIQKLQRNIAGRDWVVGDLHGCFELLGQLLGIVDFNPRRDRLLSVGDLVDRGPDSAAVSYWLRQPWFYAVRGNHEQMAIDAMRSPAEHGERHLRNGGHWLAQLSEMERAACAQAFEQLPLALEVAIDGGRAGIVHADCPHNDWDALVAKLEQCTLGDDERRTLIWSRERAHGQHRGAVRGLDLLLVGHTPQDKAQMRDNVMYLDTGAVYGDKLTLFCLNDFVEISLPANQAPLAHFELHQAPVPARA